MNEWGTQILKIGVYHKKVLKLTVLIILFNPILNCPPKILIQDSSLLQVYWNTTEKNVLKCAGFSYQWRQCRRPQEKELFLGGRS